MALKKRKHPLPGRHIGDISIRYAKDRPSKFYKTGIKDLDEFTGGIPSGEMTIIAARPGVGKTSLAMQMVEHVGEFHEAPSGVFSIEMSGRALVTRMILSRTGLPSIALRKGELTQRQIKERDKALAEIAKLPILIDDSSFSTVRHVEKVAKLWIAAGVEFFVLDYVQLMATSSNRGTNIRAEFVGDCARSIKRIAKENDVPFIVLSQLNRDSTKSKRAPTLADLKDSGELEQVADNVLILHPDVDNPPYCDIIAAKWRNGSTGIVSTQFDGSRTRFESIDPEE